MCDLGHFLQFLYQLGEAGLSEGILLIIRLVTADAGDELLHGDVFSSIKLEGSLMKASLLTAIAR